MFQISNKNRSFALSSALLLLGAAAARLAGAQNNQGDAVLEEIVVTAQKRAENLQDTPIAVSAITGEMISKLAIDSTSAIATRNPSLVYSEAGGDNIGASRIESWNCETLGWRHRAQGVNDVFELNTRDARPVYRACRLYSMTRQNDSAEIRERSTGPY